MSYRKTTRTVSDGVAGKRSQARNSRQIYPFSFENGLPEIGGQIGLRIEP